MSVQLKSRATERQMKYLSWLSRQGKNVYGKDFSIRELARQFGYTWPPSVKEASDIIDRVKHLIDEGLKSRDFTITAQDIIDELEGTDKRIESDKEPQVEASAKEYAIQIFLDDSKLSILKTYLEAMKLSYTIYRKV